MIAEKYIKKPILKSCTLYYYMHNIDNYNKSKRVNDVSHELCLIKEQDLFTAVRRM